MKTHTDYLTLNIPSKMAFRNITPEVQAAVTKSGVQEGLVFAQMADAFLGVLDAFGLAALSAGRPGIYLDPTGMAPRDPGRHAWIVRQASDDECLTRLAAIVRSHPIGGKPR